MDGDTLSTSVPELRRIANVLLDHLEASTGTAVDLAHDFYWFLDPADRRDVYREPSDGTIGQLSENLTNLRSSVESGDEVGYCLVWLAEILRTVGEGPLT
jgi:hypothetical protein